MLVLRRVIVALPVCWIAMSTYAELPSLSADETVDRSPSPQQSVPAASPPRVYKSQIEPHWFADGDQFWYRNQLAGQQSEYWVVDAVNAARRKAFDHARLAALLRAQGVEAAAERLPIQLLRISKDGLQIDFLSDKKRWRFDQSKDSLEPMDPASTSSEEFPSLTLLQEIPRVSGAAGEETELLFSNETERSVELFWLDGRGARQSYGMVEPGDTRDQHTFAGHVWLATDSEGTVIAAFRAHESRQPAQITGQNVPTRSRSRSRRRSYPSRTSPDGRWQVDIRNSNLWVIGEGDEANAAAQQVTFDGTEEQPYRSPSWSPSSQAFVAFRVTPAERKEVHRIESSPEAGGRAVLHSNGYRLPGDSFDRYKICLYQANDVEATRWTAQPVALEPIDFGRPRVRWSHDGSRFRYTKVDRGHQRFRLMDVHVGTGEVRTVLDEQTDTFIWTMHAESLGVRPVTWLEDSDELIYASEVSGWRHLYWLDAQAENANVEGATLHTDGKSLWVPGLKAQVTQGEFVVRGIDRIDEPKRQIWFHGHGKNAGEDPYFRHYYRVNFDGSGLTALTEGNGYHSIQYSPDERYLIDTYSRVDLPPVHTLRRVNDGSLVCELEAADDRELRESGWQSPEVFSAMGRDGETEIWGIISWPTDYDPSKRYPVIEDIYAGPHSAYVPKRFSTRNRYAALNDLGFIVVKIDGMGTAHRSKRFHDVCWQNLKDAGFEDRILWMKAAAKKHPSMDLDRVGIYGISAGGQNAAAAVLFHGDFYKAAVAGCGCHDNRMDKSSWNEQWMGYPVGPQYADSSNIDNAHRLHGKLFLIVGEMDNNVPPESTLRFVDALIKADKDFEMLLVPGAGHGIGGSYGRRRMRNFFVRHLQP